MKGIKYLTIIVVLTVLSTGLNSLISTRSEYTEGQRVDLNFMFGSKSGFSPSRVRWFLVRKGASEPVQISSNISTRYKTSIRRVACPEHLAASMYASCQIASFSFNDSFFGDIGDYIAQVEEEDCLPCSAYFSVSVNPRPTIPVEAEPTDLPEDTYVDFPMDFFNPPFSLHFNTNSTACTGQPFQFICYPSPYNSGANLSLLRVDSIFTDSKLRYMSSRESAIDFRTTNTHHILNIITSDTKQQPLIYTLNAVNKNDSGGYVCVGSLAYDYASRWKYMYLNVIDCDYPFGKPLHARVMEVFANPTALTFICLLIAILLITLATLIVFTFRRHHLPIFFMSPKKLSKAATKVVMETNHLYPWASPPHHNCSHVQSKDDVKTTSASAYYGSTPPGVGRNLQVPAVIIQVDNSATNTSENENGGRNNNGGGCENKPNTYKIPNDPAWEVERDCVRLGRQIGAGAFGVVYAGVVAEPGKVLPGLRRRGSNDCSDVPELTVAVKTLHDNFNEQELADLVREMEILKQFEPHPHVIQLYGACTQNGRLQVLVELAPYGNLRDFLMDRRPNAGRKSVDLHMSKLSTHHLVSFGLQVAQGMDYLTRLNIVHRDLAARNILIGDGFVAKIADFGLTRAACDYYRKCSDGRLPIKWMAPESIFDRRYTAKSDVWSFGILLWEIFSYGGTPYPTLSAEALLKALQLGIRNEQPVGSPTTIYNLMLSCWSIDPVARPAFSHLVAALQQAYDDIIRANKQNFIDSSTDSSTSSSASSRSTSPSVSTVYLSINNASTGIRRPFPENLRDQPQVANHVVLNNGFADSGHYLQSVHKAFSMHCNYVVPPRPTEHNDYAGDVHS